MKVLSCIVLALLLTTACQPNEDMSCSLEKEIVSILSDGIDHTSILEGRADYCIATDCDYQYVLIKDIASDLHWHSFNYPGEEAEMQAKAVAIQLIADEQFLDCQ